MNDKEKFIEYYRTHIKRQGAEELLEYLLSPQSDFFTAPASTRFHGAYEGGLCEHSVNVYESLHAYVTSPRFTETYDLHFSEETIAIGDSKNDIDMLLKSGLGIAVSNAWDELKAVADTVADCSNDEHIAKYVLEKYFR